jgi:hypothetical protein
MRPIWRTFSRCDGFHAFSLAPRPLVDAQIGAHAAKGVLRHAIGDMPTRPSGKPLDRLGKALEFDDHLVGLHQLSRANLAGHGAAPALCWIDSQYRRREPDRHEINRNGSAMAPPVSHDQNFKNLILDYPREALAFFAADEAQDIDASVSITPLRQEQLKERLGERFRELDVPLTSLRLPGLCAGGDPRRAVS